MTDFNFTEFVDAFQTPSPFGRRERVLLIIDKLLERIAEDAEEGDLDQLASLSESLWNIANTLNQLGWK